MAETMETTMTEIRMPIIIVEATTEGQTVTKTIIETCSMIEQTVKTRTIRMILTTEIPISIIITIGITEIDSDITWLISIKETVIVNQIIEIMEVTTMIKDTIIMVIAEVIRKGKKLVSTGQIDWIILV